MRIRKLNMHKYANCGHYVEGINGEEGFISYDTKVIIIRHARVIIERKSPRKGTKTGTMIDNSRTLKEN